MALDYEWFQQMEDRIPRGEVRTRFAPSPTGYMHVGNLRTALYTWLIARHAGGKFLLRIEDTDQTRKVEGAVEVINRTLAQCGLDHDEGPDVGGPVGPYIQTQRQELYGKYAELLLERGGAYRCFCERTEEAEVHGAALGKNALKHVCPYRDISREASDALAAQGKPYVIRQKIEPGVTSFDDVIFGKITVDNSDLDEGVMVKSDGLPTYNFANVIDDHLMGITHVVRGNEYLASAPKYNLLYQAFGWQVPTYIHCAPVMRDEQHKMSKRHGDPSYEDLLAEGYLSQAIVNYVALLGWSPEGEEEIFSLEELVKVFDISRISKSPAIFDKEKLTHFNEVYLRSMTPEDFAAVAEPYIRQSVHEADIDPAKIATTLQARCKVLTDIPAQVDFYDALPPYDLNLFVNKKSKSTMESALELLQAVLPRLREVKAWEPEEIKTVMTTLAEELGVKNAKVMWPVRIALAGKTVTPGGAPEIAWILGKNRSLARLEKAVQRLKAVE
ncbi:MAG: glutamate--tRNA ligase [Clostridiales bacterium]|nr:glutamate--tRNA ligase [Clostridiales bacterium]